ncbi:hypothetical protein PF005_g1328 [Phytophthora fragariae]|uniref:Secreted protein n=1 Tax=Phytophthora fragariae TaxID=53985 RepID=A0A6A4EXR5_9STRA|nr:hypothetical protein PF003_g25974 [Phytophthora fragariae]KAE8949098.1 hypothetical protein PF009_g1355 [Phytophthora fragariae]KAE9015462.1 hypothetical protein PF011_g7592 [Phytophthora fragariae]KAE9138106.1 hypothetical protein PF010_g1059 [Phytophthora fragariae]KAE9138805.1 hypothetical protein PF007_g1257 [Phytophthora fragariae]
MLAKSCTPPVAAFSLICLSYCTILDSVPPLGLAPLATFAHLLESALQPPFECNDPPPLPLSSPCNWPGCPWLCSPASLPPCYSSGNDAASSLLCTDPLVSS